MEADLLSGDVALVTGGGGEIGGAIAVRLASRGAAVLVADIRLAGAEAIAAAITAAGGRAHPLQVDMRAADQIEAAVKTAVDRFGKLNILVNVAAAVTPDGTAETIGLEEWNNAIAINLTGAFLTAKYAIPEMRKTGDGRIVNIASQLGQIGVPRRSPYSTTKAALIHYTKCLAVDHARDGIRANTLSPGAIDTARSLHRYGSREVSNQKRGPAHLLGRIGTVDEIAAAALFLASRESSFVTGTDLLVDGGYLAFKGTTAAFGE
ncbi:SDR family oxidoreductase [Oxalobacteraceae bacterium CAVE-383]|nr:SDR family oxidoreductase [Oxalobacteraceae bacterium CAVE-383]